MNDLLTVQDVARICHLHEVTVRRHISQGRLAAVRVGKGVRVRQEDLDAYIEPAAPPTKPPAARRKGRPLAADDPIFGLIASFSDEPWVSEEKHRVLADAKP